MQKSASNHQRVVNEPELVKDKTSGAILSTDKDRLALRKKIIEQQKTIKTFDDRISNLENIIMKLDKIS